MSDEYESHEPLDLVTVTFWRYHKNLTINFWKE